MKNLLCYNTTSSASIIDLSECFIECEEISCLVDAISCTGCSVIPSWDLFSAALDNPVIITNLETDGNYDTMTTLIEATEADLLGVVGIGPASVAAIVAALSEYGLELRV